MPAPLRCDDECRNCCLHLLGAPTCVRVPGICQCPFQARPPTYWDQRNIPHVGRRLNRGNKLERNVGQTDECDDSGRNVVEELLSGKNTANKEVDCSMLVSCVLPPKPIEFRLYHRGSSFHCVILLFVFLIACCWGWVHVQTPRPIKLNMKEAYLATWGGIWNSAGTVSVEVVVFRAQSAQSQRTEKSSSCKSCVSHIRDYSSNQLAALTKTEDDCVHADDDRSTARAQRTSVSHLVHVSRHTPAPGVAFLSFLGRSASYIPIGKKWAIPPSTMKAPATRLTMRLQGGSVCDRRVKDRKAVGATCRNARVILTMHQRSP